jgi:peptidoglycan hydrolase-like protein with peptidoglycan-binding domain
MTRGEVTLMQLALSLKGFSPGPIDGVFGRRTSLALNMYELYHGLTTSPTRQVYFATLRHLDVHC